MRQVVSYIRESTAQQGKSGLGMDAQRAAIARFMEAEHCVVLAEFAEVEGAELGNPANLGEASAKGADANRAAADTFAANALPIIRQVEAADATGYRAIAAALNARGVRTARGGEWHATTVRNLMLRR